MIALTTQNPANGGGLRSTLNMFCRALKHLDLEYQIYFDSRQRRVGVDLEEAQGYAGQGVGQMLGRLGSFSPYLNQPNWIRALKNCQFGIANTGAAHQAYVFKMTSKPFVTFVSSELYDDWAARYESMNFGRAKLALAAHLKVWGTQESWALENTHWIFTNSHYTSNKLIEKYGTSLASKISVIPLFVDYEAFHEPLKSKNRGDEKIRLVVTGRLDDERKNLSTFLRALLRLRPSLFPRVELDLVGGLPRGSDLKLLGELRKKITVRFHENISRAKLVEVLGQSDLFVLPSTQEGFAVAALEALACGVPVLSTRCGGPSDFIEENVNGGWIESINDPNAFVTALEKFIGDDALRNKCSDNARKSVISKFNEDQFAKVLQAGLKSARLI